MKKIIIAASAAILVAAPAVGFYACKKDGNNNSDKKLKKEAEFVAKNYEETCMQVEVFRDENNNAIFTTKMVANDPNESITLMVSEALKLEPQQTKDNGGMVIEIPNDAIYWLVPFDGYKPFKFVPVSNTKNMVGGGSSGTVAFSCTCYAGTELRNRNCKIKKDKNGKPYCESEGTCSECRGNTRAIIVSDTTYFVGSTYLIQSNSITLNGVTYE